MQTKETMTEQEQEIWNDGNVTITNYWEFVEIFELIQGMNVTLRCQEFLTYKFKKFNFLAEGEEQGITFFENGKFKIEFQDTRDIHQVTICNSGGTTLELVVSTRHETLYLETFTPCLIGVRDGRWAKF